MKYRKKIMLGVFCTSLFMIYLFINENNLQKPIVEDDFVMRAQTSNEFTGWNKFLDVLGMATTQMEYVRICTQDERKRHLREVCAVENPTNKQKALMYVINHLQIAACIPPKVGSKSFIQMVADLANVTLIGKIHDHENLKKLGITREAYNETKMKDYFKMITVREPFTRLSSAYLDKMNHLSQMTKEEYDNDLVRLRNDTKRAPWEYHPYSQNANLDEVLQFIFSDQMGHDDSHFAGYLEICQICDINYDVLLKLETIQHDMKFLADIFPGVKLPLLGQSRKGKKRSIETDLSDVYKHVSVERLKKLYNKLWIEDRLFGYKFDNKTFKASCSMETPSGDYCC